MPTHRKWMLVAVAALAFSLGLATAVIAGHRFTDVPDSNIFHGDITWLADNDITRGCNPPTNDQFCPKDNVTREQMAAFMRRSAAATGAVGASALDEHPIPSIAAIEALSLEVAPKAAATVVLNANVRFAKDDEGMAHYQMVIRRDSCGGGAEIVGGPGAWRTREEAGSFFNTLYTTVSVTGIDTITEPTTYKVCVNAVTGTGHYNHRNFTAFWFPAG